MSYTPYQPNKIDEHGKSAWKPGDKITADNFNHIEDGLAEASAEAAKKEIPSSGVVGQILTKTATGVEWKTLTHPEYTAGEGINIDKTNRIISVNTDTIATKEDLETKQDLLVSGENIKTINNQNILGSGNIEIDTGKIDIIKINDTPLDISIADKSVNLLIKQNSVVLPVSEEDKSINIITPTKTSELNNDGDGTYDNSPFATEKYVELFGGKIDKIKVNGVEQTIVDKSVDLTVPTVINSLTSESTTEALSAKQGSVLNSNLAFGKILTNQEIRDAAGIPQGEPFRLPYFFTADYDENKATVHAHTVALDGSGTVDKTSYYLTVPSANKDKAGLMSSALFSELKNDTEKISNLEGRGRFLSAWNATTGLPGDYPNIPSSATSPYTYEFKTGDYYLVSNIPETGVKYKPSGTKITATWTTSPSEATWTIEKAEETGEISVGDEYIYSTAGWVLIHTVQKETLWGSIAGDLSNQTDLQNALNEKSTVSVSLSGTATDKVKYITINNEEHKIGADDLTWTVKITGGDAPSWNSPLAKAAATWNVSDSAILDWN